MQVGTVMEALATLRYDVSIREQIADLERRGARPELKQLCAELGSDTFSKRVPPWIEEH